LKINKKRIAIIIQNLNGGGAERTASKLSLYLQKDRYKKYLIVFDGEKIDYDYDGYFLDMNLKASKHFLGKIITLIKRISKLRRIKKEYHIQTSISFLDGANIVNVLSKSKDKIILSIRNYKSKSSNHFYGKIHNYLIKIFYRYADNIVAVSKGIEEDLVNNYGMDKKKIQVIYNFYDIDEIKKMSTQDIEDEYKEIFKFPVIINMGRLTKQKGQWHLIRVFKKVKEVIPKIKLVFLGEGELENELKKLVYGLKIEKDVFFLGFQKNPFNFISKAGIFVFPSLYEGFPNT
jgi:glycosyltransferase involved in cell wall biosynthesis